jgi:signal transduction histidine kinase
MSRALATATALAAVAATTLTSLGTVAAVEAGDLGVTSERWLPSWLGVAGMLAMLIASLVPWWIRSGHPLAAIGLAAAFLCAVLPVWSGWSWLPAGLRGAVLSLTYLVVAGLAQVGLAWDPRARSRALREVWLLAGFATLTHLLAYNPFADPWCSRVCADVAVPLDRVVSASTVQVACGTAGVGAAVLAIVGLRADPRRAAVPADRFLKWAIGAAAVLSFAGSVGPLGTMIPAGLAVVLAPVPVTAVAGILGWAEFRARRTRASIEALIEDLANGASEPSNVAARSVSFALPGGGWVDAQGLPAEGAPAGRIVVLADRAGPAVRLTVAGMAADEALGRLTPGRRLALANSRLTALARAHVLQQQRAQREAVSRADSERHRIERDLHDGAQQHLVSAAFHLELARLRGGDGDPRQFDAWIDELRGALGRLRRISHGTFPEALAQEGLEAALSDLVRDMAGPATLDVSVHTQPDPEVARAAYAAVESALSHADPDLNDPAQVRVVGGESLLTVCVRTSRHPTRLGQDRLVADRVGALGGSYTTRSAGAQTVVEARIPCGS